MNAAQSTTDSLSRIYTEQVAKKDQRHGSVAHYAYAAALAIGTTVVPSQAARIEVALANGGGNFSSARGSSGRTGLFLSHTDAGSASGTFRSVTTLLPTDDEFFQSFGRSLETRQRPVDFDEKALLMSNLDDLLS